MSKPTLEEVRRFVREAITDCDEVLESLDYEGSDASRAEAIQEFCGTLLKLIDGGKEEE